MVSVGDIMYRIQSNPLLSNIKTSDVINYIKFIIAQLGAPGLYADKAVILDINSFQAQLPLDYISETAARRVLDNGSKVTLGHNTDQAYHTYPSVVKDGFHTVDMVYSHKIVGHILHVDFEEGQVELLYKAYQTDKNGWPLLDAGESTMEALEWYIKFKYYSILWETGKLSQSVYEETKKMYMWYIGQARSEVNIPNPIEAEALANSIFRLIPQSDNVASGHKYDSQKERLKNNYNFR